MLFAEEIANNAVLRKLDAIQNRTDLMYPTPMNSEEWYSIPTKMIRTCKS